MVSRSDNLGRRVNRRIFRVKKSGGAPSASLPSMNNMPELPEVPDPTDLDAPPLEEEIAEQLTRELGIEKSQATEELIDRLSEENDNQAYWYHTHDYYEDIRVMSDLAATNAVGLGLDSVNNIHRKTTEVMSAFYRKASAADTSFTVSPYISKATGEVVGKTYHANTTFQQNRQNMNDILDSLEGN